jgi:hypothetical protein
MVSFNLFSVGRRASAVFGFIGRTTSTVAAITMIAGLSFPAGFAFAIIAVPPTPSTPVTVYNAIPDTLPPNVASLGFQATQTGEFGDYVHLGGTNRVLNTVTVTMSDWALASTAANQTFCTNNPSSCVSGGFIWPITVNVYSNHLGANGVPDTLLATKTEDITVPWRPEADPTDCPSSPTAYKAADGNCYNGLAFNAAFDMSSLNVGLPDNVIVGVAYNTETWGASPVGTDGPYDSLNVGVNSNQTVSEGSDDNTDNVFWNTETPSNYTDGGTAGVGIFRQDTNWTPNGTVNLQITATAPTSNTVVVTPANMQNWAFVNDQTEGAGTGTMVTGPATAPLGTGSADLTVANTSDGQILALANPSYAGVKLSDLTALSYSTYQNASNPSNAQAIALQFDVSKDVTAGSQPYQGRIIFEPYNNNGGTVPLGSWNTWDALNSGNGVWWLSHAASQFSNNCSQASPCTLNQLIALYPNIGIWTDGAVVLKAGSGWTSFDGNVDALTVGIDNNNTVYDFDPTPAAPPAPGTLQITKYECPAGTSVTRADNGVGGSIPTGCIPENGATFGYVHGTQTDANAPYPELSQPFTAAGATDNTGVISDSLPSTGRYLVAETDSEGNQLPADQVLGLYCQGDGDTSGNNDNQELTFVPANGTAQCVAYDQNPDNTPPTVSVTPTASTLSGTEIFTITVNDDQPLDPSKNQNVWVYLYNDDPPQAQQGESVDLSSGTGTFTVDTTQLADGAATLDVGQVYDAAGNVSGSTDNYFSGYTIDNTTPDTTAPSVPTDLAFNDPNLVPCGGLTNSPSGTASWTASTDNVGVTGYTYSVLTPGSTYNVNPFTTTVTGNSLGGDFNQGNGVYTFKVNAFDAAGNTSDYSAPCSIDYEVAITPESPAVVTNPATDVTASDATLNATNEANSAVGHSFWVSLSPIDTSSSNIPSGVYSTPDMGSIAANTDFSASLSSLNTDAVTTGGATGNNLPAIQPNTTYYFVAWSNVDGTWYPGAQQSFTTSNIPGSPTPSTVTVTIAKYIDNAHANESNAGGVSFPMTATWNNLGADSGTASYGLSEDPFSGPNPYEAVTENMNVGSSYSTNELTDNDLVGADCSTGAPYKLVGYTTSDVSNADAADGKTPTTDVPSFTNLQSNEYVDVWNEACLPAPTPTFPSNGQTLTTADLSAVTWSSVTDNAGGITYTYEVSASGDTNPDGSLASPIDLGGAGSGLTDPQIATPNTPEGTYYWNVQAKDADGNTSPWSPAQSFTIDNSVSSPTPADVVTLSSPANGATVNSSDFSFTWEPFATSTPGDVNYEWESSLSNAQNGDGSFSAQLADQSGLTDTTLDSPNTPDNTYFWHVRATDGDGNVSPWSDTWSVTVDTSGDSDGGGSTATPPTTTDDTATTDENTPVTIDVLSNDSGATSVSAVGTAGNGTVTNNGTDVTYTPNEGFIGSDSFDYTASGSGGTAQGTVDVTVGDTIAPVITVVGNNPAYVQVGSTYSDPTETVTDNSGEELGYKVSVDGGATTTPGTGEPASPVVDTTDPGTHTIFYSATDQAGNTGTASRTVVVLDSPTVTLTSSSAIDPTTTNDNPITVTATFSEPVQSFTSADASTTNGVITNVQLSDDATSATFDVTPQTNGKVIVEVVPGSVQNLAGGTNSDDELITFDYTAATSGSDNTPAPSFVGGSNGPVAGGGGGSGGTTAFALAFNGGAPGGQVLGASTSTVPDTSTLSCSTALLTQYMRIGKPNNPAQVRLLQTFLNAEMGANLPITGFFGTMTDSVVRAFQTKYASDVLTPWGITSPTGYVYKTTEWKINEINCSNLNAPFPVLN